MEPEDFTNIFLENQITIEKSSFRRFIFGIVGFESERPFSIEIKAHQ